MKDNRRRMRNNREFNKIVFTLPKIIERLRNMDMSVVGTARFKRNWPQKEIREVTMEKSNFNDFFWSVDEHGTLIARWVDNGLVFCVTILHKINNTVKRLRKRPRKTINNRRHVDKIWGDEGTKEIYIPTLIDDYSHWMSGVDVADQRIS